MAGNFYVKKTSDNPPFQPYYSNLHTISYQKMHIVSLVQFMSKKPSSTGRTVLYVLFYRLLLTNFMYFSVSFLFIDRQTRSQKGKKIAKRNKTSQWCKRNQFKSFQWNDCDSFYNINIMLSCVYHFISVNAKKCDY